MGSNASYRYEQTQTVAEFLFSLSDCVKQDVMTKLHEKSTIGIMLDESTDIAVYKQFCFGFSCKMLILILQMSLVLAVMVRVSWLA